MLREESEAVPEGNCPVPQQENTGLANPNVRGTTKSLSEKLDRKIDELRRLLKQQLESQEQDTWQPRLAMEEDGPAITKTRDRTEGAATTVQAIHGNSFSARRIESGPKTNSTSFGIMAEPPALPCRGDVVVESRDAAFKSCLPSLEMRSPKAAGGLLPTGEPSTAEKTTYNKTPLRLYATEETNPKETTLWTSVPSAWYDSSFWVKRQLAVPSYRRVVETKSMHNRTFDPGGCQGRYHAYPF